MKVPLGNTLCIFVCIVESFFFNGIFQGFGMMTNILKQDGFYDDYCTNSTIPDEPDCTERDNLLGNVNIVSNDTGLSSLSRSYRSSRVCPKRSNEMGALDCDMHIYFAYSWQ